MAVLTTIPDEQIRLALINIEAIAEAGNLPPAAVAAIVNKARVELEKGPPPTVP